MPDEYVMEILDASGHVTLSWSPDDAASVAAARAEFERLKGCGYAFFVDTATDARPVSAFDRRRLRGVTSLDARSITPMPELEPARAREFQPHAKRTVAVRPLRGG